MPEMRPLAPYPQTATQIHMIGLIAEACVGALLGALTVLGLMVIFLALCVVMRAIGHVLSSDFEKVSSAS
jgi:hypothetical protein